VKVVLDASAIIALLDAEPGGPAVAAVLGPGGAASAVNLAEARDLLQRRRGARGGTEEIVRRGLVVVPCDLEVADDAADLRSAHYHPVRLPVSLADCIGVVTALHASATLVSSDRDQLRLAVLAGASVHPIANSQGIVPEV
jgi:PIN domain nuclease of toxin-antitoxin system